MVLFCAGGIEYLILSPFSLQRFTNAKSDFVFCTKKSVVQVYRISKLAIFICLYYRRGIYEFLFSAGGL